MDSREHSIAQNGQTPAVAPNTAREAILAILRTAEVVRRRLSAVVDPHGVTLQQYHVLRILRAAGPAGLPTLAIAERMIEHTPGVSRLIDRLEAKGYVERMRSESDRRLVVCTLTVSGARLLDRMEAAVNAVDAEAVADLSPAEREALVHMLGVVRSGE